MTNARIYDVDYSGKSVAIRSQAGPYHTLIRGTITAQNGEGEGTVLGGVTVQLDIDLRGGRLAVDQYGGRKA